MSNQFLTKVSFVNKISSIMKATSDDDSPISGYLLQEISNITFESAETCESCLEFLVDRLGSDSSHVKLKVLKLMKYIVENGHENFKLGLLKKSGGINEATKFSGPPHPLHGNTPYIMVRKAAKALTELLFTIETAPHTSSVPSVPKPQIHATLLAKDQKSICYVGIGPSQTFQSGSRMEGFGNTSSLTQTKSVGDSIKDGLLKMAEKLGDSTSSDQRDLLSTLETGSNYTPPTDSTGRQSHYTVPQRVTVTHVKAPRHIPGRAGGGWEDSDDDDDDHEDDDVPDVEHRSEGSYTAESEDRLEFLQEEDMSAEHNIVSSYVNNGEGVLLRRSQLKSFLKECSGLNCDKIVEVIKNELSKTTDSNQSMKLLLLLEFLMTSDLVNLDMLTLMCRDVLTHVYCKQAGPPQSKARKLIRTLEKMTSCETILPVHSQPDILVDA